MKRLVIAAALALTLCGCASLLQPTGSGETVTDPVTGEEREETVADAALESATGIGGMIAPNPFFWGLVTQVGGLAISGLRRKKQPEPV